MMRIIIVVLSFIIVGLFAVLWKYQRQIKDICRQLHFLKEHDSNMRIMTDIRWGNLSELCKELNEILQQQKLERRAYMRKEREISETYTNLSHDIRTPLIFSCWKKVRMSQIRVDIFRLFRSGLRASKIC